MPRTDILEKKEEILKWIEENQSKAYICKQLQCKPETLNSYLQKMGIEYKGNQGLKNKKNAPNYKTVEEYIKQDFVKSHILKQKLIKEKLKENKCEICGLSEWLGKPIPLELHHKNCNHYDNSLDNLQILCPNCHALQPGNSGANSNKNATVLEMVDNIHLECMPIQGVSSNLTSSTKEKLCIDCGKQISSKAERCKSCAAKFKQPSRAPSREELKELIRNNSFLALGKQFNVSDNAVRKWCKNYNLPYQSTVIKNITDEDWVNI